MLYDSELKLLCETFKRSRVSATFFSTDSDIMQMSDDEYLAKPDKTILNDILTGGFLQRINHKTLYKTTDRFGLRYIFFLLPESSTNTLLIFGPYTHTSIDDSQVLEIGEMQGFSPQNLKRIEEYCAAIPIISENSHLFIMLDCFCEHMWKSPFEVIDLHRQENTSFSPTKNSAEKKDDILLDMKSMELRYKLENEIMDAVANGQSYKVNQIFTGFNERSFEKRINDSLRNHKNYCIIMNTLFRKAAERGGVHPMYIDRISSNFAAKIEQLPSTAKITKLMADMFTAYCELVKKRAIENYSPIVAETIIMIDSDISADLSLSILANKLSISSVYLSTLFKKELGLTLTQYIRNKRMDHAAHLLRTTNLQVQTIATHCGITDLQYFTKQFKKHFEKTPKEYRSALKI